jgi:hypothetical protein
MDPGNGLERMVICICYSDQDHGTSYATYINRSSVIAANLILL